MNKQNLTAVIKELITLRGELGLKVSDDNLFIQACTYDRGESINKENQKKDSSYKPSIKQLKILLEAGIKENVINQMTKLEVSKVIGEYLNSLKRENI